MRITAKGQITIPLSIRKRAGLLPGTEVEVELDGRTVRIVKARSGKRFRRGALLVAALRGRGDIPTTTDKIMALTRK